MFFSMFLTLAMHLMGLSAHMLGMTPVIHAADVGGTLPVTASKSPPAHALV